MRDRHFIAVEPRSFGGWIACWRELHRLGIDPLRFFASLEYGNTHDAVVNAVKNGTVDGGTVRTDTLERMAETGSQFDPAFPKRSCFPPMGVILSLSPRIILTLPRIRWFLIASRERKFHSRQNTSTCARMQPTTSTNWNTWK